MEQAGHPDRFVTVTRLADDVHVVLRRQHHPEALP
jgi:hypothetical protein